MYDESIPEYDFDNNSEEDVAPILEDEGDREQQISLRRSKRQWKPTEKLLQSIEQQDLALMSFPACLNAIGYDKDDDIFGNEINHLTLLARMIGTPYIGMPP